MGVWPSIPPPGTSRRLGAAGTHLRSHPQCFSRGGSRCFLSLRCVPPPFPLPLALAGGTCRGCCSLAQHHATCSGTSGSQGGGQGAWQRAAYPHHPILLLIKLYFPNAALNEMQPHLATGYFLPQMLIGRMLLTSTPLQQIIYLKRGDRRPHPPRKRLVGEGEGCCISASPCFPPSPLLLIITL